MNTFQIYEDFKGFLGEPAAKSLAHTLGTMFEELRNSVTKEDFRILRESIDANVSRLDSAMERLADAQGRTEAKVSELAVAQARTESTVAELVEGQTKLTAAQADVAVALQRLTIRTDAVVGRTFEL